MGTATFCPLQEKTFNKLKLLGIIAIHTLLSREDSFTIHFGSAMMICKSTIANKFYPTPVNAKLNADWFLCSSTFYFVPSLLQNIPELTT